MDDELYQEQILDHYRSPRHKRELVGAVCKAHQFNPLCGDELTVYMTISGQKIKELTFTGQGCAISQAAASLVLETLQHKTLCKIKELKEEKVLEIIGIPITVSRMKCALLIHKTLQQMVKSYENNNKKTGRTKTNKTRM